MPGCTWNIWRLEIHDFVMNNQIEAKFISKCVTNLEEECRHLILRRSYTVCGCLRAGGPLSMRIAGDVYTSISQDITLLNVASPIWESFLSLTSAMIHQEPSYHAKSPRILSPSVLKSAPLDLGWPPACSPNSLWERLLQRRIWSQLLIARGVQWNAPLNVIYL